MDDAANGEDRVRRRLWDVARILRPESAAKASNDEFGADAARRLLAELRAAGGQYVDTWETATRRLESGRPAEAADALADLLVGLLLSRLFALLTTGDTAGEPTAILGAARRAEAMKQLVSRFPQCQGDFEKVEEHLAAARTEDAASHLSRMVAGLPARRSGILWPLATRASWVRVLGRLADPEVKPTASALVDAYWIPVRELVVRRFRFDRETAENVTSDFFADAVVQNSLAHYDPNLGSRFRHYLAGAVHHFAIRWRDRHLARVMEPMTPAAEEQAAAPPDAEPDAQLECSMWRWRLSHALAETWQEVLDRQRASAAWQVFEAVAFAGGDAPPGQEEIAKRFGITVSQVNNYVHRVRKRLAEVVRRVPGGGEGPEADGAEVAAATRLGPPACCAGDARFAFESADMEASIGPLVTVRVGVLDAAGAQNPLPVAPGVAVVKVGGVGQVVTPPPHRLRGTILDGRYVRVAEAVVRGAEAGTLELGLEDVMETGLGCEARMTMAFR